jgi:hypothetical protein
MSTYYSMTVRNESTSTTLYGVCVVHYCNGNVTSSYASSLAPGASAETVTCATESGETDWYYVTFGYFGTGQTAIIQQGWSSCNAPSSATSMYVHLSLSNYYIQYNNKTCSTEEYDTVVSLGESNSSLPTAQFDMVFANISNPCTVSLLHMASGQQASSFCGVVPANSNSSPVTCYNSNPPSGDLYSIVYMYDYNVYMGVVSSPWNPVENEIVITAPIINNPGSGGNPAFAITYLASNTINFSADST